MMERILKICTHLLNRLPADYLNYLFELVLKYAPLSLIRKLPFSYGIYAKCFPRVNAAIVFDCGSHIGNCAILFSRLVGPNGLVICLEPFKDSYTKLLDRKKAQKLHNVVVINKGVWKEKKILALEIFQETISCRLQTDHHKIEGGNQSVTIECITIDDLVRELKLERLDYIKMDIEGAEIEALLGATQTLTTLRPQMAIASYHHRDGQATFKTVEKILKQFNYRCRTIFPPHLTTYGKPL